MFEEIVVLFVSVIFFDSNLCGFFVDFDVGQCYGDQQQFGEDQYGDVDVGGDGQVVDYWDVYDYQYGKVDDVVQQCGQFGEEQMVKGVMGGNVFVCVMVNVLEDVIYFLCVVGDFDGEDQEWYQNGVGIQFIVE